MCIRDSIGSALPRERPHGVGRSSRRPRPGDGAFAGRGLHLRALALDVPERERLALPLRARERTLAAPETLGAVVELDPEGDGSEAAADASEEEGKDRRCCSRSHPKRGPHLRESPLLDELHAVLREAEPERDLGNAHRVTAVLTDREQHLRLFRGPLHGAIAFDVGLAPFSEGADLPLARLGSEPCLPSAIPARSAAMARHGHGTAPGTSCFTRSRSWSRGATRLGRHIFATCAAIPSTPIASVPHLAVATVCPASCFGSDAGAGEGIVSFVAFAAAPCCRTSASSWWN